MTIFKTPIQSRPQISQFVILIYKETETCYNKLMQPELFI